jgi:superfamily II DNA or RNA helicase
VDSAKAICDNINAVAPGMARTEYGTMTDSDKRDTLYGFKHGHFQVLCSVNMLTKGFDHAGVANVFMCRPTRSKRLYTQVLGRGTRLSDPGIGNLVDARDRRAAIAASTKPMMTMYNMVGINADVRDLKTVDILGGDMTPLQRKAANEDLDNPANQDRDPIEVIEEAKERIAEIESEAAAKLRAQIEAKAEVRVKFSDALKAVDEPEFRRRDANPHGTLPEKTMRTLKRFNIAPWIIARLTPTEANYMAGDCIRRVKGGWCSLNQAAALKRMGIDPTYIKADQASKLIAERYSNSK